MVDCRLNGATVRAWFDLKKNLHVAFYENGVLLAGMDFAPESLRQMSDIFRSAVSALALSECDEYDLRNFNEGRVLRS